MKTDSAQQAYKQRHHVAETPFAVIKSQFGLRQFSLRGHEGVKQEWQWFCLGFNLKKMMNLWGQLRSQQAVATAPQI